MLEKDLGVELETLVLKIKNDEVKEATRQTKKDINMKINLQN